MNTVSFFNLHDGGILIRNISNRVQLNNVTFTNSDITEIDTTPTTRIQMGSIVFTSGRSITVGPAAEFSIEDSTFQGGSASALYLHNIAQGNVVRCHFHNNSIHEERAGNMATGGALSVLYSSSVTINESIFYANSADVLGGDIYGSGSNITIDRSTFTASSRSGVYIDKVNMTVMNSNFSDGRAISGTSINAVRCPRLQIIACTFANNTALNVYSGMWYGSAGALRTYLCDTVQISNSHFINNTAAYAGAILCHDGNSFTVTDCSFSSNVAAHEDGGAMRVYASYVTLLRSVFDGNSAITNGGAVYVTGMILTANWINFTNNRADSGGALYVHAVHTQLFVSHGYFKNNTASNGSGGAIFNDGQTDANISLVDSTFEYNSAASCGVLNIDIYIYHSMLNVTRSTFSHNMATDQSIGGGVICVKDAAISVADSTFSHNSAGLHAGVMYVDDSILIVERSSFISNSADGNGGVMYTNTSSSNYTIILSNFVNTAGDSGGVMYIGIADSQVSIRRSSCSYNSAVHRGGALAIIGSDLIINETNVFNNTARLGGAISACNSDVTVPSELAETEDSADSECILYSGYINRYNFIHQDVSTTSMPVTMTTTSSSTTKNTLNFTTITQTESTTTGMNPSTNSLITTPGSTTASPITSSGGTSVSQPTTKNVPTTSTSAQTEPSTTDRTPSTNNLTTTTGPRTASPTTNSGGTGVSQPTTKNVPTTSTPAQTEPPTTDRTSIILTTTGSTDTSLTNSSENGRPMIDSTKISIIIAVSCVSAVVIIGICVLVGVFVTIKIIGKLKRRSEYRYTLHNENEFAMQEAE
jgi:predicted outer membrane repeat protein